MPFKPPQVSTPETDLQHHYNHLCAQCGQRWADHTMLDRCPTVVEGKIVRHHFEEGRKFKAAQTFKFHKDVVYIDQVPK